MFSRHSFAGANILNLQLHLASLVAVLFHIVANVEGAARLDIPSLAGLPEGHTDFVRIVVAGRSKDYCVPCAVCRQVLREFAPDIEVICLNGAGEEKVFTLPELLPHSFGPEFLA